MLRLIKILHTIIWAVMAASVIYILYAAVTETYNIWFWLSLALMVIEICILLYFKMTCPLTNIARKYSNDTSVGIDIYLPKKVAKYNKIVFGTLLFIGVAILIINYLT